MTDIVERLQRAGAYLYIRSDPETGDTGEEEWCELPEFHDAAEEITRLRGENDRLADRLVALAAAMDRLEASVEGAIDTAIAKHFARRA